MDEDEEGVEPERVEVVELAVVLGILDVQAGSESTLARKKMRVMPSLLT